MRAENILIKNWFIEKNFTRNERYAISEGAEFTIERETEKAVLAKWSTEYGKITKWIPKSCIVTREEAEKQKAETAEKVAEYPLITVEMPYWLAKKNLLPTTGTGNQTYQMYLIKETEKAIYVKYASDIYGDWLPKSQIKILEQ